MIRKPQQGKNSTKWASFFCTTVYEGNLIFMFSMQCFIISGSLHKSKMTWLKKPNGAEVQATCATCKARHKPLDFLYSVFGAE